MSISHYSKAIMDTIHGQINLDKQEVAVVDHPLFQRLRFICQNDVLHFVFPSAVHTRFSHSIGAMYMADKIFDGIISRKGRSKHEESELFGREVYEALNYLRSVLRLSVLLHDVGHGSFSHQFEMVPSVQKLLSRKGHFEKMWPNDSWKELYDSIPESIAHEHYSVKVTNKILQDIDISRFGIHARDVLSLMETTDVKPSDKFMQSAVSAWPVITNQQDFTIPEGAGSKIAGVLSQLVSGQLDADKFDYMLRDSAFSGVSYGSFNFQNLIGSINIRYDKKTGWLGLAIFEKGLPAFEDFVLGRYNLYKNVYNHKAACLYDIMLKSAIEELMAVPAVSEKVEAFLVDSSEFQYFTDHFFWEMFRKYAKKYSCSYSAKLLERRKFTHLLTVSDCGEEDIESKKKSLIKHYSIDPSKLMVQSSKATFSKINKQFEDIRIIRSFRRSGDISQKKELLFSISDITQFFEKFSDIQITHFYYDNCDH